MKLPMVVYLYIVFGTDPSYHRMTRTGPAPTTPLSTEFLSQLGKTAVRANYSMLLYTLRNNFINLSNERIFFCEGVKSR